MSTAALQQLPLWSDEATEAGWRVRRSRRARRLGVRIFRDGSVEIVAPLGVSPRQVSGFVERHRAWIDRHRQRAPRVELAFPPTHIELPALGESWQCEWRSELPAGERRVQELAGEQGGVLQLCGASDDGALRAALLDWLCERARSALTPMLATLAANLGVEYRRVQIRRQRTRWGSCSAQGTISLNCCLLFHRPAVVRYLLAHELAHRTHMNHGKRFWTLVERYEPDWRNSDRELTRGWNQVPGWVLQALRA